MKRPDVSMTAAEVASYIADATTAVIAANGDDGFVVDLVSFLMRGDVIEFDAGDKLTAAIHGDPRVCVTVEEFGAYEQLRGAVLHGTAGIDASGRVVVPVTEDVMSFDFAKLTPKD